MKSRFRRSALQMAAMSEEVHGFLTAFPEFAHLGFLSSAWACNMAPNSFMSMATTYQAIPSGLTLELPQPGKKDNSSALALDFLIKNPLEAETFVRKLKTIQHVSSPDYRPSPERLIDSPNS